MLNLVYSSRTEKLLDALVGDLREHRQKHGALEPAHLVVHNRNVEAYLRFGIAKQTGIAANLEVHLLRRFVGELVGAGEEPLEILDASALRALVLEQLLDDEALAAPELEPVRRYLRAAGDASELVDVRRVQLADKLGRLFEEYGFSRAELLRDWPKRAALAETPLAATERWQRALWLRLFGQKGTIVRKSEADGVRRVPLGSLLDAVDVRKLRLPQRIHVFGVSYVARAFQRIFAMLAERTELHVYTLNPCREFWEDLRSAREVRQLGGEDPYALTQGDNAALRLWGRPGRENIRLLNTLAECNFHDAFPEPSPSPSLLERVQQEILERAPQPEAPSAARADDSIRVLACPSIRREAEVVAEEIWALVEREPELRFNEIAVIVAGRDRDAYFSHLSAAFRACHDLPHNVVDLDLAHSSRIAEAVNLLLAVPHGNFTRPELLDVLSHPASRARGQDVDPARWVRWCERLEILHGGDHGDHASTYITRDVYNWDQGLRRLALGAFMTGERSGDERGLPMGDERYFPEEHDRSDQAGAASLAMAARSLIADARFARQARLTLREWSTFLSALVEAHLVASAPREERELGQCLAALRALGEIDLGDAKVGYRVAYELATRELGELGGGRGQHLADGVVISTSQPMRAIPFKVIFMVGLGEGEFPSAERRDPLDLRAARPQAGDVSPRERDRYLFLETLLCARRSLRLSYVARNPVSGEALAPSAVVSELLQLLESCHLGAGGRGELVRNFRLRRHELEDEGAIALPQAERERVAARLRASLAGRAAPTIAELRSDLQPEVFDRLARVLGMPSAHPGKEAASERPRLSVSALRRFLECPLQGYARFGLGLPDVDDDEEDPHDRSDERFATERLELTPRLRRVFAAAMNAASGGAPDFERTYRELVERLAHAGRVPEGVFGEVEQRADLELLQTWAALLGAHVPARAALREHRFGAAQEGERVDRAHDGVRLEVEVRPRGEAPRRVELELVGRLSALAEGPWTSVIPQISKPPEKWAAQAHDRCLAAYLDQLMLAAAGLHTGPHRALVLFGGGAPLAGALELAPISSEHAREQLATIAGELLSGGHAYLLPCQAVFDTRGGQAGRSIAHRVEELREHDHGRFSSRHGPIRDLSAYHPLPDDVAERLVESRFGSYLSRAKVIE